MFRRLFAEGAFQAAFIPLFQSRKLDEGDAAAKRFAEEILAFFSFVSSLLTLLIMAGAPFFVYVIAGGFHGDPGKLSLTTLYIRIMFPYLFMMILVGIFGSILNVSGRFAASAGAPLALNIFLIATILFHAGSDSTQTGNALAWAVFAGGLAQAVIVIAGAARRGYLLKLRLPRLTPSVRHLFAVGTPGFISAAAIQINLIIGTNIASRQQGAITWLMNADQLYQLPLALIGIAMGTVLLPKLSGCIEKGNEREAVWIMNRSAGISALLSFPAATVLLIAGVQICDALFRGIAGDILVFWGIRESAFTSFDVTMTGKALGIFACGLPAFIWNRILSTAFYARKNTYTPMKYALISIGINITLALSLFPSAGFVSIPFATVCAAWIQFLLLAGTLYGKRHLVPDTELVSRFPRIILATAGLAIFLHRALQYTDRLSLFLYGREWIAVLACCGAGMCIYIFLAVIFRAIRRSDYKTVTAGIVKGDIS